MTEKAPEEGKGKGGLACQNLSGLLLQAFPLPELPTGRGNVPAPGLAHGRGVVAVEQDFLEPAHGPVVRPLELASGEGVEGNEVHFAFDSPEQLRHPLGVLLRIVYSLEQIGRAHVELQSPTN